MAKDDKDAGNPNSWESAQLAVTRPTSVMLSVRMPANLVIELEHYASTRSMTISDVIRQAVERTIAGITPAPTYALIGTTASSSLKLAGPTVMVHVVSSVTRLEWVEAPTSGGKVTGNPVS